MNVVHGTHMQVLANHCTILLRDMSQCSVNRTQELYTIVSTDGRDVSISIPNILSCLLKPKKFLIDLL